VQVDILLEEQSAEAALKFVIRDAENIKIKFITHQGKGDLLKKLPAKLSGYKKLLGHDYRLMVLLDRDKDDCVQLKNKVEAMFRSAGILSKTANTSNKTHLCVSRIIVEELESWLLGDTVALKRAFPNLEIPRKFEQKQPDAVGNPSEVLQSLLKKSGYKPTGKIDLARRIGMHWDPNTNRSLSFKQFILGLESLR
jgi:Domain of unknown function (DUF4276)